MAVRGIERRRPRVIAGAAVLLLLALPAASSVAPGTGVPEERPARGASETKWELAAGKFLVASQKLRDPNFASTVVLLVAYGRGGAMGLIVNRPTELTIAERFPDLKPARDRHETVYAGGPVAKDRWSVLVQSDRRPENTVGVLEDVYAGHDPELLERLLDGLRGARKFRVYFGHAGWAAGQLDHEVLRGGWHVLPGDVDAVFSDEPGEVWRRLLPPVMTDRVDAEPLDRPLPRLPS